MDLTKEPSKDEQVEDHTLYQKLVNTLDEYQEQSYLLDPYLEKLGLQDNQFFPHEVADLWIVLGYLDAENSCAQNPEQWALRYVLLLWLSLVCMLPFHLSQFDESENGHTARVIEHTTKRYLSNAGLEREGAAIVLSHYYMRQDTSQQFVEFFEWSKKTIPGNASLFTTIGILHVLCEVLKSGPLKLIRSRMPDFMALTNALDAREILMNNTLIRKFKTKLISRVSIIFTVQFHVEQEEDIDVPEEVEAVLDQLFAALQDKDTLVRWSAAKGVARIAERLSTDLADQVLETVLGHFAIHSVTAASLYDVPAIAEATWHGACLACAEMTRRGIVPPERLEKLVGWLSKALYFDLRKGAHSVGSNVRDASAYGLWALARSQEISSLAPLASDLARHLVTVSLYDREVQIRRAASAGFQEFVGRTSLFPHGIDVLRKTDFYAVGIRRNSFLLAAPQVAEHIEYRPYLLDHLLNVTLRHWDISMRRLGAQSLRRICLTDILMLGPEAIQKCVKLLQANDNSDIHGGLAGLTELTMAYEEILSGEILESKKREEIKLGAKSSVPNWSKIVEYGLKHRDRAVQESATATIGSMSKLTDCSNMVLRLIKELIQGTNSQRILGRLLGVIDYDTYPMCLPQSLRALLEGVNRLSGPFKSNVEARQACFEAMPILLQNTVPHLSYHLTVEDMSSIFDALLGGLNDYSVDERGDVGSWIRIACVNALGGILKQGVERLDNVRQESGRTFTKLLSLSPPDVDNSDRWIIHRSDFLQGLFVTGEETGWNDANWLFPKAVKILDVETYRKPVLLGLITSVGSLTDSTHRPVSANLVSYRMIFLIMQTRIPRQILLYPGRIKNIKRLHQSMKVELYKSCVETLPSFLSHQYPSVRSETAEFLYISLQSMDFVGDTEEAENLLLETEWSSINIGEVTEAANSVSSHLLTALANL
ncbi:TBCD protein [Lentinula edodes]|uniref:TBCD protein n=1 Tax=Lentinula edodes TaxID=5353 RepID=A0A1Q3EEV4_LENED|nr:TBCD protein [Lentinula edodes]